MFLGIDRLIRMSAMRNAIQLSILFIVIMVLAGIILRFELARQVYEEIDHDLEDYAQSIGDLLDEQPDIISYLLETGNGLRFYHSAGFASNQGAVLGPVNAMVFRHVGVRTLSAEDLFNRARLSDAINIPGDMNDGLDEMDDRFDVDDFVEAEDWRVLIAQVDTGRIAVFTPVHEVDDVLDLLPAIMLPITLALIAITLLGGVFLGRHQQRRIDRIHDALSQIATGHLSFRLSPTKVRDDMDDLMVGFDEAAQKLETSIRQMSDFSRNVAHELRTPLTELRAALETEEGVGTALSKTDDIIRTFDAVLRISRLARANSKDHKEDVALNAVGQLLHDLYADSVDENGQSMALDLGPGSVVVGDRQLLIQLGSNLIENAMKYAGPDARITVRTGTRSLTIEDTGPGIPPEDRAKVIEPLFTGDQARRSGSTGLGLALANAIADHHNAMLALDETPGGGLSATIQFQA